MTNINLTISPNYVKHWGIVEGLREIMQNTIDQKNENEECGIILNYSVCEGILTIGNQIINIKGFKERVTLWKRRKQKMTRN